jgi:hypothetical protein
MAKTVRRIHSIECFNPSNPAKGWTEFVGSSPVPSSSLAASIDLLTSIRSKGYPLCESVKLQFRIKVDIATTDWDDPNSVTEYSSEVLDY